MKKRRPNRWKPVKGPSTDDRRFVDGIAVPDEEVSDDQAPRRYSIQKWSGFGSPNPAMLRQTLVSEGYSVFQWTDAPGSVYGMHSHDTDQSHWIISGSLELNVERSGVFVLEAGDRDFMPKGTYHSARVLSGEPVIYLIGELRS